MLIKLHPNVVFKKTNRTVKIVSFDLDKYFIAEGLIADVIDSLQVGCEESQILQELSNKVQLEQALAASDIATFIDYFKRWGLLENFSITPVRPNEAHSLVGSIKAISFNQIHFNSF